ncbi:MAG TPA: hypothetical protein VGF98_02165 [Candidatus Tumulicola sp.]|jgi:hypothetical protein
MIDHQNDIVAACLSGASDKSLSFQQIAATLEGEGFESLLVDFRRSAATFYQSGDGAAVVARLKPTQGMVGHVFAEAEIRSAIKRTSRGSYQYGCLEWWNDLVEAGCAGFIASFSAHRVIYFGRNAEALIIQEDA